MPRRRDTPTLRFDRIFRGVGRVARSSGTSSAKEFARRDALLTELADAGQLEALRAFQAGDLLIEHLIEAKRSGELSSTYLLRDVKLDQNLWDALDELYGASKDRSTHHRYHSAARKFARVALRTLGRQARIRDLRRVDWQLLRRQWGASAADWNHLRRMISRSLTHWMGDVYDPFRRAGVPTAQIQAALRHAGPEMTRRYEMQRARRSVALIVGQALLDAKRTPTDPQVIALPRGTQPPEPRPDHRRGKRRARLLADDATKRGDAAASGNMSAEAL
jgi:hypothetical protein